MKKIVKIIKTTAIIFLILITAIGGSIFYAFKIEPYRIKCNKYELNQKQENKSPLKVLQLSDLHIKEDFTAKNLDKIVKKVNEQKPDIIVFTGDLYDNYAKYHDDENIISKLNDMKAKYCKVAIWGNRDYGGGAVRQYEYIMESAGFTLLKNGNWYITLENNKNILFTGVDDSLLGNPYMPDETKLYDSDYNILLTHEPDSIDNYFDSDYDIALSGHSHGGQINIPFLPFVNEMAITATSLSSEYSGGMYTLSSNSIKKLYVNTGIGTTHIPARFGVVPEIALFYIYI